MRTEGSSILEAAVVGKVNALLRHRLAEPKKSTQRGRERKGERERDIYIYIYILDATPRPQESVL